MKRMIPMLIATSWLLAAPAHGGAWIALGASSHLTCGQFLALPKENRDGAESWAYGYLSAWQEALLAMAERAGDDLMQTAQDLPVKPPRASKFMADVAALCQERPATLYVDAIGSTYQTWRKQTEVGRGTGSPPRPAPSRAPSARNPLAGAATPSGKGSARCPAGTARPTR